MTRKQKIIQQKKFLEKKAILNSIKDLELKVDSYNYLSKKLDNNNDAFNDLEKTLYDKSKLINKQKNWIFGLGIALALSVGKVGYDGFVKEPKIEEKIEYEVQEPLNIIVEEKGSEIAPTYRYVIKFNSGYHVLFNDDVALNMKGFAKTKNDIIPLKKGSYDLNEHFFLISKELINNNAEFKVFAIDKDGNQSKEKTVYTYKGFISDKKINY